MSEAPARPIGRHVDYLAHCSRRRREAEQRTAALERHRDRLERLLALALRVATSDGRDCDPLALLGVLEQIVVAEEQTELVVRVLRQTDPARIAGAAREPAKVAA